MARQRLKPGEHGEPSEPKWNEQRGVWQQSCLIGEPIGRPSRVWGSGPTKPKCSAALRARIAEWKPRAANIGVYRDDCTVIDAVRAWLASMEKRPKVPPQTVDSYRREIELSTGRGARPDRFVIATSDLGAMRANDVRPVHVRVHLEQLNAFGGKQRAHKTILSQAFEMLTDDGLLDINPVKSVKGRRGEMAEPSRPRPAATNPWFEDEPAPFSADDYARYQRMEAEHFAANPRIDRRYLDFRQLAYEVAARPGECLALRWSDVDLDAGTVEIAGTVVATRATVDGVRKLLRRFGLSESEIVIRKGWQDLSDGALVGVTYRQPHPKTKESRRIIKVGPDVLAMLRRRKLAAEPGAALVFPSQTGLPMNARLTSEVWRKIVADTDLSWSTPRTLRSTRATRVAEKHGVAAARQILGHEEGSKVTTQHYVVVAPTVVDFADAR
ncbi:site-specific integrase [Nocardia asteroides]|uniref:site-specific integrase n=1 Tax=Nocardia asteroides TaxID=1824 RepID=UPI00340B6780